MYSQSILFDFLHRRADLSQVCGILAWSDGGKHFRCNQAIASSGIQSIRAIAKYSQYVRETERCNPDARIKFGVAHHFKNKIDSECNARISWMLEELSKSVVLTHREQLVELFPKLWQEMQQNATRCGKSEIMDATFIDFFPRDLDGNEWEKESFIQAECVKFQKHSFAEQITICHHWQFKVNDWRKNNKGSEKK